VDGGLRRKILGRCLAANLLGELRVGTMAGVVGSGTMATGFSAAAEGASDGTRLEVAEFRDLPEQREPVVEKSGKWVKHGASCS
jgi:hypothetical protein